ncbi:MAG: hypothetical protein GX307_01625 [Euryarchaeota archaeon]|nr:hypothetical protein [Euryarchaeota archaeon]
MSDPTRETIDKLKEEERRRRLQEGGESMKAQLAMEEAQRARSAEEGTAFSGLTPQEAERRRMMEASGGHLGMGESQQAQMAMWGKEEQRGPAAGREARPEFAHVGEPGALAAAEQMSELDRRRELARARGELPGERPSWDERMKTSGAGVAASAQQAGEDILGRTRDVGSQAWGRTKEMGSQITRRTREATGGASAEELAAQAGESIGRGIRKIAAVGSGIITGLRRGMGETREQELPGRPPEGGEMEGRREPPREYRETEYREVRHRERP